MKLYSKLFRRTYIYDKSTEGQLNEFLREHPTYTVNKIEFDNPKGTCIENLFVIFDIEGGTETVAEGVLKSVWREANCGVYDTTDIKEILEYVAKEYDIKLKLDKY